MNIGITYDLRADYLAAGYGEEETAEFDRPDTIEAIDGALRTLGYPTDRIGHLRHLVQRLADGDRWDLVFNIAEGLRGFGREAQVPAVLDAYEIPYTFSDPLVSALTLHKGLTKHVLRSLGIRSPEFHVVETEADVDRVRMPYPLFVKPVAEGTAKGIDGRSRVNTPGDLRRACERVLEAFRQPALVETYLPGREFTVGITGTGAAARAVATIEITLLDGAEPHGYTYINKERCEELCRYVLADPAWAGRCEAIALDAWRGLGCRDGGRVDVRADANGDLHVLELNPLPGLHPEHSDLPILATMVKMPYLELIRRIVDSARLRVTGSGTAARRPERPVAVEA